MPVASNQASVPVVAASATASTTTSTTASPMPAACVLDPQTLSAAIQPWLATGSIAIDAGSDEGRCKYDLPPGSFNGTSADFIVDVYAYADEQQVSTSTHGVSRQYGGSTPQQVYASARAALLDLSHAGTPFDGFADYPNVGAGMVTDGESQFILAGTHAHWYTGGPSNTTLNPNFNDALVNVGKALAAH